MTDQTPVPLGQGVAMSEANGGFSVTPAELGDIVKFAEFMAFSEAGIPAFLRGKAADCAAVIMQSMRWGMDPFAVAQCSYKVKDIIAYEAKLIAAVANTRSGLDGRLKYSFEGEGNDLTCTVTGTIDGEELTYTSPPVGAITTKNSPLWNSDVQQQLGYFSARSWVRRHTPEVMLGVYDRDEAAGFKDVTPQRTGPSLLSKLKEAKTEPEDTQEGFGTAPEIDTDSHQEPNAPEMDKDPDGDEMPLFDPSAGEEEPAPPKAKSSSPTNLNHLPGDHRRAVQAFARVYFAGMNPKEREEIAGEYADLRQQSADVAAAMDTIIQFVALKEPEKLCEFTGLTDEELREAA